MGLGLQANLNQLLTIGTFLGSELGGKEKVAERKELRQLKKEDKIVSKQSKAAQQSLNEARYSKESRLKNVDETLKKQESAADILTGVAKHSEQIAQKRFDIRPSKKSYEELSGSKELTRMSEGLHGTISSQIAAREAQAQERELAKTQETERLRKTREAILANDPNKLQINRQKINLLEGGTEPNVNDEQATGNV